MRRVLLYSSLASLAYVSQLKRCNTKWLKELESGLIVQVWDDEAGYQVALLTTISSWRLESPVCPHYALCKYLLRGSVADQSSEPAHPFIYRVQPPEHSVIGRSSAILQTTNNYLS